MEHTPVDKILVRFMNIVLAFLAVTLLLKAASTLNWRMEHDVPLLHYGAFLMDKYHAIPYRDIFATFTPGSYAFHYAVVKLFGYTDLAFRCVDLSLLAILLSATYVFMSRFGRIAAIWSSVVFGLIYLSHGQAMSLQRDYVGIIPIALALMFIPAKADTTVGMLRFAIVGFLSGIAVLMKPQLGISLPILLGALLATRWSTVKRSVGDFARCVVILGLAFALPVVAAALWLAANSALAPFADICFRYLPLYNVLTGELESVSSSEHVFYLIQRTLTFGGYGTLFLCSLFAFCRVLAYANLNRPIIISLTCLLLCTVSYAVYPTLAGKFWGYHYMPFAYFCSVSTGLCFAAWPSFPDAQRRWRLGEFFVPLTLLVVITAQLSLPQFLLYLSHDLLGSESHSPRGGRVDEIAAWLKSRLRPGDTVQPLDWTGGSIHAMLLAKANLSTKFIYDGQFYHDVSSPYIQELRREFISQLVTVPPRFIIEVQTHKPWVSGIDTTREFPELHEFVSKNYSVVYEGDGYLVYERTSDTQPQDAQHVHGVP